MPIKCLSIPKRRLEVPTKIGAIMGIDRRSFLTASASVILTVTTIGGKQFAQVAGVRSPEAPWQEALEEKSADPRIRAMAFAILAPNVFNLQPMVGGAARGRSVAFALRPCAASSAIRSGRQGNGRQLR